MTIQRRSHSVRTTVVRYLAVSAVILASLAAAPARSDENGADPATSGGSGLSPLWVYGLTQDPPLGAQRLIFFRDDLPAQRLARAITGVSGDTKLVGIDFRPATGELYGLGDAGGIYTINLRTAVATFKVQLSVALSGTSFGVDFNPTVDRLRVVSNTGQNLRVNVVDGLATVDTALSLTGVAAAAYTNNDADPNTATTLFDLDANLDQIVIQAPPNNGSLNPTGKLLVDAGSEVGFDIYSRLRMGTTVDVRALASLVVGGRTGLYQVNLFTGKVSRRGLFRSSDSVVDIAIQLDQD